MPSIVDGVLVLSFRSFHFRVLQSFSSIINVFLSFFFILLQFAMKKSFKSPSSRYWVFRTPLFPEWIPNDDSRAQIEQAARGSGELPEDCLDELRRTVRGRKKRKGGEMFMIMI